MHHQVKFQAVSSATMSGQLVGVVLDEHGRELTRTHHSYDTADEALLAIRVKWNARQARLQMARAERSLA